MKSIRKTLCVLLTVCMLFAMMTPAMASDVIKVRVGGELIDFDVQPRIINGRTMVPLRAIFEALGASVNWDGATKTVTSTKGGTTIKLTIDNPTMDVNGTGVTLDSPACIIDGRTLVPVRAISEAFKLTVDWIASTKTVKVKTKVSVPAQKISYDGSTTTYHYDEAGNCVLEEFSEGGWRKNGYDKNGNWISSEYDHGYTVKYVYNDYDKLIYQEDNNGNWTKYNYDKKGNLISEESSDDSNRKYTYDGQNNLIFKEFGSVWLKYTYDTDGKLLTLEHSNGYLYTYTYDAIGNEILEQSDDGWWQKSSYDSDGKLISETTSDGSTTTYTYDSEGYLLEEISRDSDGNTTTTKYKVIIK